MRHRKRKKAVLMSAPSNNDFTVKFANVNGTGSSSANGMFMKSIFRMGIPVLEKITFHQTFKDFNLVRSKSQ